MALSKELLGAIESLTETEEAAKSFEEGYLLGLDSTRDVRFEGQALPQFFGGLSLRYNLDETEVERPTASGEDDHIPGKPSGYSEDPAFVLGAALAACKLKHDGHEQVTWLDKGRLNLYEATKFNEQPVPDNLIL